MKFVPVLALILQALVASAGDAPKYQPTVVDHWWQAVHTIAAAKSIRTAVEAYALDNNRYPGVNSMDELRPLIEPTYIRTTPMEDAWGTPFLYRGTSDGKSFTIASAGSDKAFDESTWTSAYTMSSKEDLVYQRDVEREWVIQRICK